MEPTPDPTLSLGEIWRIGRYQPGSDVNISDQNKRIPCQNNYIVLRQARCIGLLNEIDLLSFRQSGAIG
jgi:hypothetical protein